FRRRAEACADARRQTASGARRRIRARSLIKSGQSPQPRRLERLVAGDCASALAGARGAGSRGQVRGRNAILSCSARRRVPGRAGERHLDWSDGRIPHRDLLLRPSRLNLTPRERAAKLASAAPLRGGREGVSQSELALPLAEGAQAERIEADESGGVAL